VPVAAVALLWNLLGLVGVAGEMMMDEATFASMDPQLAEIYKSRPLWALGGSVLAVLTGVSGCVGLLLKKRWATWFFGASLVGLVLQNVYPFVLSDFLSIAGPSSLVLPGAVFAIAIALLGLSAHARRSAWLQ